MDGLSTFAGNGSAAFLTMFGEGGFLAALARSPTLWTEIGGRLALLACVSVALVWAGVRMARAGVLRGLARDRSGSASAVGFVMVTPFVLFLALAFAQLAMLLNNAILVHYAAYSAARSARVWMWDFDPFDPLARLGGRLFINPLLFRERHERVREEVESAARFALIPAAPVSGPTGAGGAVPDRVLRVLAQSAGMDGRADVLVRQARYAYDPANSQIDFDAASVVDRPELAWDFSREGDAWPVQARVRFRVRLDLPAVRFFGDASGGDWYTTINAEMTLL